MKDFSGVLSSLLAIEDMFILLNKTAMIALEYHHQHEKKK